MKLREIREKQHMTLRALAEISGVHYSTISKIENEFIVDPGYHEVLAIAGALGVRPEELFQKQKSFEA
jgi:transcriptional regulator with XRE-family HTH domain